MIVSARVGAGHDGAAREIARRLGERGVRADRVDFLDLLPGRLGQTLCGAYHRQLQVAPRSWGWLLEALGSPALAAGARRLSALAAAGLADVVGDDAQIVVSIYPLATHAVRAALSPPAGDHSAARDVRLCRARRRRFRGEPDRGGRSTRHARHQRPDHRGGRRNRSRRPAQRFRREGQSPRAHPARNEGDLAGVVSNLERAGVTGGVSTGHGVPFGWRFGADPAPSHLLMAARESSDEDLLTGCGEGLVVSWLDYLRVLHPKDTLVTGTTRGATYWVSGGNIVAWHPPVRLTFRMDEVLDHILAVGAERERGEQTFMESITAPALLVDAGPFRI
ncbi:metallopeptidase TldD-related protein [Amycolatopsis carbonis]|uniref:Metallopeptidase TldD-related protein n=1 Tax=Amycolatopsis carbonis TaxID=715471 RepID=A0A9Y2MQ14_9PSEU|nr:metallopeptidase TldD-related protein [Amycolatopsis sp. 2-15]WIX76690.1 metallopeptidase TldD-related protein [Amycolatopsis sp. 2-15]